MNFIDDCQPSLDAKLPLVDAVREIVLVGCGHLGHALLSKWNGSGFRCITVSSRIDILAPRFPGVDFCSLEHLTLPAGAVVVLAIPPQAMLSVLRKLPLAEATDPLFVSVAAGLTLHTLAKELPPGAAIARVMPNLSVEIGESVTAASYNTYVSEQQQRRLEEIFQPLGEYFVFPQEQHLDVVTPLIGSGPAFLFLLCEAMEASAEALGISKERASQMVRSMLKGGVDYLCSHADHRSAQLREAVTSKAGVTAAVMDTLRPHFEKLIYQGIHRGQQRCRELNSENSR